MKAILKHAIVNNLDERKRRVKESKHLLRPYSDLPRVLLLKELTTDDHHGQAGMHATGNKQRDV